MKRSFFVLLLLVQFFAKAQSDTTELQPVEVRALRAGKTAPFAKTDLKKAEIEKQNFGQDLPLLLNQTPSVVVHSDAGNGVGYTGIRIRGVDPTRINVTLNGVPFNDAESQGSFFVNLPDFASSVNSLQIQRGVGTSSSGPAAFGATINLSTHEVNDKAYAEFNNSFGSFHTMKNTIRAGTGLMNDHFTADVRLSRIASDGYIDRASTDLHSFFVATAYRNRNTNLRFNVFSGKEKTYQAWYGVSESDLKSNRKINYAGMEKPGEPYDNETDNYKQDHYQLFFDQKFNEKLSFNTGVFYVKGSGYYEQYKVSQPYAMYGLPEREIRNQGHSHSDFVRQLWLDNDYYGNIFSLLHRTASNQITLGGAVTHYKGDHFGELVWARNGLDIPKHRWYDLNADKKDYSLFTKWQQDLFPMLQLFTDLQYRAVDYTINGFRDNPELRIKKRYHFFNPKLGLTYHKASWQLFGSYSIGNKEPNRDDFEAGTAQQPRREQLHDMELGIEKKQMGGGWSATLYYMRYKDQLVLTGKINDVGAYARTNIDNSYRLGVELQHNKRITDWLRWSGNLTLSRNKVRGFTEYVDDYDNGGQKTNSYSQPDLSFSPRVVGAGTFVVLPFRGLEFNLISKYVGKQYLDNTQNESRKLNAYFTEDLLLAYSFNKLSAKEARLFFQINNIFNRKYEPNGYTFSYYSDNQLSTENYYYPMAGTNFMIGFNIRFEKAAH